MGNAKQEKGNHVWKNDLKKYVEPTTEGNCPYCHKPVKSVEKHIRDRHRGEKLVKKK